MRKYIIYEIRNVETGCFYVGISGSSWSKRINDHLVELSNQRHHCEAFQRSWNQSGGITEWSFRILKCNIRGSRNARKEETIILSQAKPELILNSVKKTGVSWHTVREAKKMRQDGKSLKEISQEIGVAISTASKIINGYPQFEYGD